MFALVDCNNFYASCERVFRPALNGRPVVVRLPEIDFIDDKAGKPVGLICIAPALAARIYGAGVQCTIGNDPDTAATLADMGAEESARMLELLRQLKPGHAILLVEHDMDAVFRLADRISVLVSGRIIASGTPAQVREHAEVRKAYLGDELVFEAALDAGAAGGGP